MADAIESVTRGNRKVDLMVRVVGWSGFDMKSLFEDDLWKMKFGALRSLRRYALVGGPSWMGSVATMAARVLPYEIRVFRLDEEDEARRWLDG